MFGGDQLVGLDIAHRRELRMVEEQAQAVVDQQDRRIIALQRALAAAQASNRALLKERGERNMSLLARRIARSPLN